MDSNFQFRAKKAADPDLSARGPRVCRLAAGGNRIRTIGSAKAPGVILVSSLVRADFSVRGGSTRGDMRTSRTFGGVTAVPMVRIRFREGLLRRWLVHPNISDEPRDCYSYARVR
jgi:hypothetical protein